MSKHNIEGLVERYKDRFGTCLIYGMPITELEGDELRACILLMGDMKDRDMRQREKDSATLNSIHRLKTGRQHD